MWVIPPNAGFQCEKAHFATYHAVCTAVLSVMKQMRLHALGRQVDARRERIRKGLTSVCPVSGSKFTKPIPSSASVVGESSVKAREGQECHFRKSPSTGKDTLGVRSAFPRTILLFKAASHTFFLLPSPTFWFALISCLLPRGGSPIIPRWLSSQTQLGVYWTYNLCIYPCLLWTWEHVDCIHRKLEERVFAADLRSS